ncbi:hypothetical protein A4E84_39710 [Streptomyces qaidamensis]|uniref:Uncharacterized protein n=1 Tax=Streptomyces qaidamensis TaxID=1783515 RepID=A0A143CD97_9ACTN|nr:hypothetical protein [Streptomyces qaidamensis]AMW15050.1 hypothetical protein A4E84_39710 [Streptomyces qaidamensis]
MPKPIRSRRRTWLAGWVLLCGVGIAATAWLNAASAPDPRPEAPVSPECAEYIADIETQLAKAKQQDKDDGVLAFSRSKVGAEDCSDEIRDHFGGDR